MKRAHLWVLTLVLAVLCAGAAVVAQDAEARAGGGRSFGSSGSRSYAAPSRSYSGSGASTPGRQPAQTPLQPASGGFLRSMGGGILGGLMGGMLFSSLGFGGAGGGLGGSGFGLIEIALLGGIGYLIFNMVRKKREAGLAYAAHYQQQTSRGAEGYPVLVDNGMDQLCLSAPSFDESLFKESVMDIFFRIQGCWTNRDLSAGVGLLTDEIKDIFQADIDKLVREKKSNKLENIAVRKVEMVEAWQEAGLDYVKAMFTANLLDYTLDDATGDIIAGSKTDPVKFEECWTFVRTAGNSAWKLTAISQV